MSGLFRPNVVPIHNAVAQAITAEADRSTLCPALESIDHEFTQALARAVTKALQQAGMLNYDRPWEDESRG